MNVLSGRFTPGNRLIDLNVLPPELRPKRYPPGTSRGWWRSSSPACCWGRCASRAFRGRQDERTERAAYACYLAAKAQTDMGQARVFERRSLKSRRR
jgi:hypothetical protein